MELSKYNIISKIKNKEEFFIINLLSGNADILKKEEAFNLFDQSIINDSKQKGYIVDKEEENKIYKEKYKKFLKERNTDEIQIFFVPRYACNFNCSYCYQKDYQKKDDLKINNQIIDSFFDYIQNTFKDRNKYITIFGGEPLLPDEDSKNIIKYFIEKSNKAEIDLAIVTNGFHLKEYLEYFKNARIREIQVTLDGTEEIHNRRRTHKNKKNTFTEITEGIDEALKMFFPINLRIILDKENINNFADFAKFCIDKGWTKKRHFKTQIGRNYDLHSCQSEKNKLFSRINLYEKIYELINKNPEIIEFHKPAFSVSKFLKENGKLPEPLFDSCPACKTEWAFDWAGKIYPCTANVGQQDESVGTFYPEIKIDENKIKKWQSRDVVSINQCSDCALSLTCGGGCGNISKEKSGDILTPDCRPIKELLEMGIAVYFKEEK